MTDYTEQNNLQIITDDCDNFCLSSPRELSITRDVAERLVFAQMSEISYDNVAEYYARLSTVAYAYRQDLMSGTIFDDDGNELYNREFKAIDFISRIGVKTNLVKDTLRNFLTRAADRLLELYERSIINYEYSYDDLLKYYQTQFDYFLCICDLNQIGRVDETIGAPGLIRALDLALVSAEHAKLNGEETVNEG